MPEYQVTIVREVLDSTVVRVDAPNRDVAHEKAYEMTPTIPMDDWQSKRTLHIETRIKDE